MEKNLFNRLVESMTQMDEIDRGERPPSREFHVDAVKVKMIRKATRAFSGALCQSDRCCSGNAPELGARSTGARRPRTGSPACHTQ